MNRRTLGAALGSLMAAAMLITGCADNVSSVPQAVSPSPEVSASVSQAAEPASSGSVPAQASQSAAAALATNAAAIPYTDAIDVVLAQYPEAVPVKCALELEGGKVVWDVDVLAADGATYEAAVDAASGALIFARKDDDWPEVAASDIKISYAQAVQSAADLYPDCFLEGFEVERENGVILYDIELRDTQGYERTVFVNAQTGEASAGSFGTVPGAGTVPESYSGSLDDLEDYYEDVYGYDDDDDYDDYYYPAATQTVASGNGSTYRHHASHHADH